MCACWGRAGGAGVEVLKNEACNHPKYGPGQHTLKKYYIHEKVKSISLLRPAVLSSLSCPSQLPGWMRTICPKASAVLVEESYNCYPYVRTEITMALFKKLKMTVETQHKEGPAGTDDNALQLNAKRLKQVSRCPKPRPKPKLLIRNLNAKRRKEVSVVP